MSYPTYDLTFNQFQNINGDRCEEKFSMCSDWTLSDWGVALAGEASELCNILKKLRRGDFTIEDKKDELAKELADIITYADLIMSKIQRNTGEELLSKFNEVSQRVGYHQIK